MIKLKEVFDKIKSNKKTIISIIMILSLILLCVGASFAVFNYSNNNAGNNGIDSGHISMTYTEPSNEYVVENALPIKDAEGVASTNYFEFSVTTTAKTNNDDDNGVSIPYEITITESEGNTLNSNQIKMYLTEVEGEKEIDHTIPTLVSYLEASLYKDAGTKVGFNLHLHRNGNETITTRYRLRAWIDYDVDVSDWDTTNKYQYKFRVNVNGEAQYQGYHTDQSCFTYDVNDDYKAVVINGYDFNKCNSDNIIIPDYFMVPKTTDKFKEIKSIGWPSDSEFLIAYKNMYYDEKCSGYDSLTLCLEANGMTEAEFEEEAVTTYNSQYKVQYNQLIGLNYYDYEDAIIELVETASSLGLIVEFVYGEDEVNKEYFLPYSVLGINGFANMEVQPVTSKSDGYPGNLNNVINKNNDVKKIANEIYNIGSLIVPSGLLALQIEEDNVRIGSLIDKNGNFPKGCFEAYNNVSGGGYTIYSYYCDSVKSLRFPATIEGVEVKKFVGSPFVGIGLESVTFPNSMTEIFGDFSNNNLTRVVIPDNVTKISANFSNNKIAEVDFPEGLVFIGGNFSNNQLIKLNIPNSATSIEGDFSNNQISDLKNLDNITSIANGAFANNKLTSLVIPDNGIRLGNNVFKNNNLTKLVLPDSVVLGTDVFAENNIVDAKNLDDVFPKVCLKYTSDGNAITLTGYNCIGVVNLIIPDKIDNLPVTVVGDEAFRNKNLKMLTISNTVKKLNGGAFADNKISNVIIPDSVTEIGYMSFRYAGIDKLVLSKSLTVIPTAAFEGNKIVKIEIPNSVVTIGGDSFIDNKITNLIIPDSVTTIGGGSFADNKISELKLGKNVTSIGAEAFMGNNLSKVVIPSNVTNIYYGAFHLSSTSNPNLKIIVNTTGRAFDWETAISNNGGTIRGQDITGTFTYNGITVKVIAG